MTARVFTAIFLTVGIVGGVSLPFVFLPGAPAEFPGWLAVMIGLTLAGAWGWALLPPLVAWFTREVQRYL